MPDTPISHALYHELVGTRCQCGDCKTSGHTFCRRCYHRLPRALQLRLYRRMGEGYEEAYAAAREHLKGGTQ